MSALASRNPSSWTLYLASAWKPILWLGWTVRSAAGPLRPSCASGFAGQPVRAVVEHRPPLGHRPPGVPVQLHPVREEPALPPDDLHVADRDQQVLGTAHLLDLVGHHGGLLRPRAHRDAARGLLRPRGRGTEPGREETDEERPRRKSGTRDGLRPDIGRAGAETTGMRPHASSAPPW